MRLKRRQQTLEKMEVGDNEGAGEGVEGLRLLSTCRQLKPYGRVR